jgi:predicted amidophosphoribosyltransferase
MAMAKCKECGHRISTTAKTCPNCGHEFKSISRLLSSFGKELISLAVVLFLLWMLKPYWPEPLRALFESLISGQLVG